VLGAISREVPPQAGATVQVLGARWKIPRNRPLNRPPLVLVELQVLQLPQLVRRPNACEVLVKARTITTASTNEIRFIRIRPPLGKHLSETNAATLISTNPM
jgi:hypothetical protein